jgi:hypothetical protein
MTSTFKNEKLQILYNKLNSQEGYNLRGFKNISTVIYPLLEEVIHDDYAYSEAVFDWPEFQCVVDVVENGDKEYTGLSDEDSMCYSLWWNTNHSSYKEQEGEPELEEIFNTNQNQLEVEDAYADSTILQQVHNYMSNNGNTSNTSDNDADYIFI